MGKIFIGKRFTIVYYIPKPYACPTFFRFYFAIFAKKIKGKYIRLRSLAQKFYIHNVLVEPISTDFLLATTTLLS
jgi:hypothetical protein